MTAQHTAPAPIPGRRNLLRLYATESLLEFSKLLRLPIYSISVLVFPAVFYLIFGPIFGHETTQGIQVSRYMVAAFSASGVLSAALFGFGIGVATERAQGWMLLKRVSPMPALAYFVAKIVMALIFSAIGTVLITAVSLVMGFPGFSLGEWLRMFGLLMLGVMPFAAIGVATGYLFGPNSAPVVINLLYMPLSFLSGLWIPFEFLPTTVQGVAQWLPTYHYAQLALSSVGAAPQGSPLTQLLILTGTTLVFLLVAVWAYRRDMGRTFG